MPNLIQKMNQIAKGAGRKIKQKLDQNHKLTQMAVDEMNKKYPAGWAQNAYHMGEMSRIRKTIKKSKNK